MFHIIIKRAQSIGSWIGSLTHTQSRSSSPAPEIPWVTYQLIPYKFEHISTQAMQTWIAGCQQHQIIHTRVIHHQHHTQLYLRVPQVHQQIVSDLIYHCRGQTECILTNTPIPPADQRIQTTGYEQIPTNSIHGTGLTQIINTVGASSSSAWTYIDINPKTHHITTPVVKQSRWSKMLSTQVEKRSQTPYQTYALKIRYSTSGPAQHSGQIVQILQGYTPHPITIQAQSRRSGVGVDTLAQMIQIPDADRCQTLSSLSYRKLSYPANLPKLADLEDKNGITLLGSTEYRNQHQHFGILTEDKLKHMYVIGKTGTGKSTLISQMVKSDMVTHKGLCLIDPHGDLIQTVLQHVPSYRINDVILFDVADHDYPIGFNVLQANSEQEQNLVVSGLVTTFKKLYGNSRGPRLEYILRLSLLTIIQYPQASLIHLTKILTDKHFRTKVLGYVKDPLLLNFWYDEFEKRPERMKDESISPILNKVGQFLSSPIVRHIFGQTKTNLDLRKIMDQGKILLVNLSKGQIGEDNCDMIGSFLVSKFQIDALSRADENYEQRRDFYLYIDEFQNFATESFATIFSEARKYKLSLIVANQYIGQLPEDLKQAIFGNVGSIIAFTLGYDDAIVIRSQYKDLISEYDLQNLPKFHAYIRMMIQGIMSDPFSMSTFPLTSPPHFDQHISKIREQSRQRYAQDKKTVQQQLQTIHNIDNTNKKNKVSKALIKSSNGSTHEQKSSPLSVQYIQKNNQTSSSNQTGISQSSSLDVPLTSLDHNNTSITNTTDLVIGNQYTGIVKLKYNYGLFVVVGKTEGLLHKSKIALADRKKTIQIGDTIEVKASETIDVNGISKAVWTQ